MDFDIHQFDDRVSDSDGAEAAFQAFRETLLERFTESPEGQERRKADPDMGFWAAQLRYDGYQYEGSTIPRMTVGDVQTVVTELFPRKISLHSPEQAGDAIPELTAFWTYLKRAFHLPRRCRLGIFARGGAGLPRNDERSLEFRHGEVVFHDGPGRRV